MSNSRTAAVTSELAEFGSFAYGMGESFVEIDFNGKPNPNTGLYAERKKLFIDDIREAEAKIKHPFAFATTNTEQRGAAKALETLGWEKIIVGGNWRGHVTGNAVTFWWKAFPQNGPRPKGPDPEKGSPAHGGRFTWCCGGGFRTDRKKALDDKGIILLIQPPKTRILARWHWQLLGRGKKNSFWVRASAPPRGEKEPSPTSAFATLVKVQRGR